MIDQNNFRGAQNNTQNKNTITNTATSSSIWAMINAKNGHLLLHRLLLLRQYQLNVARVGHVGCSKVVEAMSNLQRLPGTFTKMKLVFPQTYG